MYNYQRGNFLKLPKSLDEIISLFCAYIIMLVYQSNIEQFMI